MLLLPYLVFLFCISHIIEMETTAAASSPYLLGNQKRLYLVRHAQGLHNLEAEKNPDRATSINFVDAELSPLGWQQVRDQRKNVSASGLLQRIEVVITSPLARTLQTAVGIFGGGDDDVPEQQASDDIDIQLKEGSAKIVENCDDEGYYCGNIISTLRNGIPVPPIIASELCRERMSKGRRRGSISQCRSRFPEVDFSLIEREDDILWEADERETNESVAGRGIHFIKWLLGRKEKEIAVVSHGVFLQQTMIALQNNPSTWMDSDPYTRFGNCEIRSMIICKESVMGLAGPDSLKSNYKYNCGRLNPYNGLQL